MFNTIKHTFALMGMSWGVLMKDRELILFPVFAVVGLIPVGLAGAVLTASSGDGQPSMIAMGILLVAAYVVTVFFNAALVSAALERLRGGDPDIGSGLRHAMRHIHHIVLWAIISATVNLALRALERRAPDLVVRLIGGAWEFLTFFVVPVMVSENHGPITSIKRSAGIVRQTWGRQLTASFGFFLVYIAAFAAAVIPALLLALVVPLAGIVLGVLLGGARPLRRPGLGRCIQSRALRLRHGRAARGLRSAHAAERLPSRARLAARPRLPGRRSLTTAAGATPTAGPMSARSPPWP